MLQILSQVTRGLCFPVFLVALPSKQSSVKVALDLDQKYKAINLFQTNKQTSLRWITKPKDSVCYF